MDDYGDYGDGYTEDQPADYSTNDGISPEVAADLMEGLGVAGVNLDGWNWIGGATASDAPTTGDFSRADRAAAPTTTGESGGSSLSSKFGSFLSGTGDFINKYKTPLEMLGRGIQSAAKSKADEKAAQALSDSRINELKTADQLKQDAAGRYSNSVKGLRTPGLMMQGKLQRVGGTQVFDKNGLVNRG